MTAELFEVNETYHKNDIYRILDVPEDKQGGDWDTGYHRHGNDWFIFANIEASGRTGHDYQNHWEGDKFVWFGRTGSKLEHNSIQSMIGPDGEVLIFTRGQDRADWNFEGPALVEETFDQVPVKIIWSFDHIVEKRNERSPEETSSAEKLTEGASQSVKVNRYERNPQARKESIDHHGCQCVVCGFDFEDKYGEIGDGYIEVHHVKPLSDIDEEYEVDPVEDLKPVCPNCHAMIHRNDPPLEIDELQELIH